jgi:hypothetical protein
MANDPVEWVTVTDQYTGYGAKEVGAIGFLNGKAVLVVSFFDDSDANYDGTVGWGEWAVVKAFPIGLKNMKVTRVAMIAQYDDRIIEKDATFSDMAKSLFLNFAKNAVLDGVYTVYMSRGVKSIAKSAAVSLVGEGVRSYVVRKGMEKAVKSAYDEAFK